MFSCPHTFVDVVYLVKVFFSRLHIINVCVLDVHSSVEAPDCRVDEASDDRVQDERQNLRRNKKTDTPSIKNRLSWPHWDMASIFDKWDSGTVNNMLWLLLSSRCHWSTKKYLQLHCPVNVSCLNTMYISTVSAVLTSVWGDTCWPTHVQRHILHRCVSVCVCVPEAAGWGWCRWIQRQPGAGWWKWRLWWRWRSSGSVSPGGGAHQAPWWNTRESNRVRRFFQVLLFLLFLNVSVSICTLTSWHTCHSRPHNLWVSSPWRSQSQERWPDTKAGAHQRWTCKHSLRDRQK